MEQHESKQTPLNLRTGFGVILLVLGIIGAIWLASLLINLVHDFNDIPEDVPFVAKIVELGRESAPLKMGEKTIVLPSAVYYGFGIIIYLIVLGLGMGLVKVLIEGGVHLLHDKIDKLTSRLNREFNRIKASYSKQDSQPPE